MNNNVFNVRVYFEYNKDEETFDGKGESGDMWIVADTDISARTHAITIARKEVKENNYKGKLTKVLYCDVKLVGTIDGYAPHKKETK